MSWLWPRKTNDDATMLVRTGRLLHWCFVGFAILFATVSIFAAIVDGDVGPVIYLTVILIWSGVAMLGRGLRYLLAHE